MSQSDTVPERPAVAIAKTLLVDAGLLAAGVFCAGRWYKEAYFWEFGVTWDLHDFPQTYYLFGSWFVLLWAASHAFLAYNLWLHVQPFCQRKTSAQLAASAIRGGTLNAIRTDRLGAALCIGGFVIFVTAAVWWILWFMAPTVWIRGIQELPLGRFGYFDWVFMLLTMVLGILLARRPASWLNGPRDVEKPVGHPAASTLVPLAVLSLLGLHLVSSAMGRYHVHRELQRGWGHPIVRLVSPPERAQKPGIVYPSPHPCEGKPRLITRMEKDRNFICIGEQSFIVVPDAEIKLYEP